MTDDRYEKVQWRGHSFDRYTIAAIEAAEALLGHKLTVLQGSYNGGTGKVSASAGTHDGGGAVDFAVGNMPTRDVRVLRSVGFAAWHRLPSEGPWSQHIHCVLIGNTKAAPSAQRQVTAYRNGRNGLATNRVDNTWRPTPIPTFHYPEEDPMVALLNELRAVCRKHGVSRIYGARVLLKSAAADLAAGAKKTRVNAASAPLYGVDDPKK